MIDRVGNDIGGGAVAADMLRPASVVGFRIAAETGKGLMRLACAGVVGALLVSLVAGSPPNWGAALLAVPSAVVAVACHVVAQHAYAAAAFWFNEAKAAWSLFQKLVFVVGGMLLPLEVFPPWLQAVARLLPFWTMA